ncbi:Holliday junction ATP-dependent DNA helicase RuvB [Candidatus Protochlamydia amoebophila]|uniref:Holliday junction branch migration DNA helicase RuvB n=1 Tax=Candidatus Protochlamydia amoebophila TaxID=362787 RepID=UPI001BCA084A|nr:Holliday junction branch migration DNA helicase RuvB [Candidatus Protochlamydia amoebophila]MBS4163117.1 Holliday junction ATP-dependent DNA helicase RuvB [Candidatus Protochlamydia amoebophila]
MNKNFIESNLNKQELSFEVPLRPQCLTDFVGQDSIRDRLEVHIGAARQRGEVLGHCLFSGPPGLGKTTLASILSKAMESNLVLTSGPVIEKAGDLAGILTSLKTGDVLFIDEIHRLNRSVEEYLYQAMEDFVLDLMIDSGPNARSIQVKLNQFTLAGATTRLGLLSEPLRSRFAFTCRLEYYDPMILQKILLRTSRILNVKIDSEAALEIAKRSRGTPRVANHLLRWVRDFAQIKANNYIDLSVANQALTMLSIDEKGLDEMDKKMLQTMIDHYSGGPVGINAIAASIGEEPSTVEEVYEPYLILQGLLKRTPRGREVTSLGYQHIVGTSQR